MTARRTLGRGALALVGAAALLLPAAVMVLADGGSLDVQIADRTGYEDANTDEGAKVEYIGDLNETFGSSGSGTFDSFVRLGDSPTESGYNTDGTREFDTMGGAFTHSILVSDIPVVMVDGEPSWELFADLNESDNTKQISLNDFEVYYTDDPELSGYPFGAAATLAYDFDGDILINDVNQGSGRGDLRYTIPISILESPIPAECGYKDPDCDTYFVLYTQFGTSGAPFESDGGFEEWKVKSYPYVTVAKTATPSFTRTYAWTIDKSGSPLTHDLLPGQTADTDYDIAVGRTVVNSDYAVSGTIAITNPTNASVQISSVADAMTGGIDASVDCGVTYPHTLAKGATLNCTYSATLPDGTDRVNTATVLLATPGVFTDTADVDFDGVTPTVVGYDNVDVTDTFDGGTPELIGDEIASGTTLDNDQTFSCSSDPTLYAGDGFYSYTRTNVAEIVETGQTDDETVTVNCYAPVVSKTADGTFDRDWAWDILKTGDQSSLELSTGQSFLVNYDVTVSASSTDSNFVVSGTITVENPAGSPGAMDVDLADSIGTTDAVIDCGDGPGDTTLTVAVGTTGTCDYAVDLGDTLPTADTNTATVTFREIDFEATDGFGFALDAETDECIDVSDDQFGDLFDDGTICAADLGTDLEATFEYAMLVGPFNACGEYQFVNVASFETNDNSETGSDNHTVNVTVACGGCTLTQGYWKTHSFAGPAPYDDTWALLDSWVLDGIAWVHGDGSYDGHLELFFRSGDTWYDVFWTAPAGNAYYNLAHQYEAAVLNILNDASAPANVTAAIAHAEELFMQYTPADIAELRGNNPIRKDFIATAGLLASYNEGSIGPGHCDEDSLSRIGY